MKERTVERQIKELQDERARKKYGEVTLPQEKLYAIDKIVRKKLLEKPQEVNYSELIDPAVNEKYDVLGLGPGPDEEDQEPGTTNQAKEPESSNLSPPKDASQDAHLSQQQHSGDVSKQGQNQGTEEEEEENAKRISFEEWLYKKEAESKYWKLLLTAENEEMKKMDEEKLQEKQALEDQK